MSAYHAWLIRQRIYCEARSCWKPATRVLSMPRGDECRCDWHGYQSKEQKEQHAST